MKHNNPSIGEDSLRLFNLKTGDALSEISPIIQPSIEILPRINIARQVTATNATSATVYTTPTDKDFYLCTVQLAFIKDVTSTSTQLAMTTTIDGVACTLIRVPHITLTVGQGSTSISYPIPVKIDRGVTIAVTSSTNVANVAVSGVITGYTVETVKGV